MVLCEVEKEEEKKIDKKAVTDDRFNCSRC